jgi:cold shock CspA family protein
MKYEGTVSVFITRRKVGFIIGPAPDFTRVFFHASNIVSGRPYVGAKVLYDIDPIREGVNPGAINVEITEGGAL